MIKNFDTRLLDFLAVTQTGKHYWKSKKGACLLPLLEEDDDSFDYDSLGIGADGFTLNGIELAFEEEENDAGNDDDEEDLL